MPPDNIAAAADFLLIHGNGVSDPAGIVSMVDRTRALPSFHGQPVLFNEDDPLRLRQAPEQFSGRLEPLRRLGLLRLSHDPAKASMKAINPSPATGASVPPASAGSSSFCRE